MRPETWNSICYHDGAPVSVIEIIGDYACIEYHDKSGKIEMVPYWELDEGHLEDYDDSLSNVISLAFRRQKCQKRKNQNANRLKRLQRRLKQSL